MKRIITLLAIACCAFGTVNSQVVINEFSFANYTNYAIGGQYEDWVEFYNPSGAPVNIGGFWLSDRFTNPQKWQIPANTTVPANGFRIVLVSGTGDYNPNYLGQLNTNFRLTQTAGEELVFTTSSGTILEVYDFDDISPNQMNHSWGRSTNGGPNWVIFTNPTPNASNGGNSGTAYAARPQFNLEAGHYGGPISVELTSPDPNVQIRYTTNGNDPVAGSTLYTGPINLSTTTVLRAAAFPTAPGTLPSFISTNTYFFGNDTHSITTVSVSGNQIGNGLWTGDERCHIEFFGPGGVFQAEATGDSNEHGNDSNAYGQRGFDYITRDEMGYDNEVALPIFTTSDRQGFERLIFKAAANDNYPFSNGGAHIRDAYVQELSILGGLELDERKTHSCIVYLNGSYWGVYEVREKVDDVDFTDYYFNQPRGFLDFLKTWGGTWAEYGTNTDWVTLRNFITSNNMANAANYEYVLTQLNTNSLIDYFIINTYIVSMDWLNWNTAWWRGRHPNGSARQWRYTLWDMDASFGHYVNYTGIPSTSANSSPCQIQNMNNVGGQGHIPMLNALFNNPNFEADYINRYAMYSNTIFSCERMIEVLDSMIAVIQPEMQRQIQRWGGTMNGWNNNVNSLRNFINTRCNVITNGIANCYDVVPYTVTFEIDGEGKIIIVETPLNYTDAPWQGTYFGPDVPIPIQALVEDGGGGLCGSFQGWEITSGQGIIADPLSPTTTMTIQSNVTLVAHFGSPTGGPAAIVTDVSPIGAGIVTVDGVAGASYPAQTPFDPGSEITLTATANEWYEFVGWQQGQTQLSPDTSSPTVTLQSCNSDTVTALFNWIPNYQLTVMIEPFNAGTITMDGALLTLPWSSTLLGGVQHSFSTSPASELFEFEYWTLNNHVLSPSVLNTDVFFTLNATDTLVAVYRSIPLYPLTVLVQPAGAGRIEMDGTELTLPHTEILMSEVTYGFYTESNSIWNVFEYWTTLNHDLAPDDTSPYVMLNLMAPETLVAVYRVIPHHNLTVRVEPQLSGTVIFGNGLMTETELTGVYEGNIPMSFAATPDAYWRFVGWKSSSGHFISPNQTASSVTISLTANDTITAYFEKEPFTYYVPNSFTPNGDGVNDAFGVASNAIDPDDYRLMIFNRWGEKLFDTTDPTKFWDGSHQGGEYYVEDGVYVYRLRIKNIHDSEIKELTGSIMMFR